MGFVGPSDVMHWRKTLPKLKRDGFPSVSGALITTHCPATCGVQLGIIENGKMQMGPC
jgi:hypothetical protein